VRFGEYYGLTREARGSVLNRKWLIGAAVVGAYCITTAVVMFAFSLGAKYGIARAGLQPGWTAGSIQIASMFAGVWAGIRLGSFAVSLLLQRTFRKEIARHAETKVFD
jgi:hypothetical protein